ncbi:MAG: YkgJ family cysteine cluster protein [Candidatus Hecatellaceae archaeon]
MALQTFNLLREILHSGRLVPWRLVHDWVCQACGDCCRRYLVELTPHEYAQIVQTHGHGYVDVAMGKMYLRRRPDGSCYFLYWQNGQGLCGLQPIKPKACKLWPFQVFEHPSFGNPELSLYRYGRREFYIYVVSECRGLTFGQPSPRLEHKVIPEILEIKLGRRVHQQYSTSQKFRPLLPLMRI